MGLKKKLEKYNDFEEGRISNFFDKEVLVVEPTMAINNLHDELSLYRNCYENLSVHFKQNKMSLLKYESLVNELTIETSKLRTKIKLQEIEYLEYGKRYTTQPDSSPYARKRNLSQNITQKSKIDNNNYFKDSDEDSLNKNNTEKNLKKRNEKLEETLNKEEYNKKFQEKIREKSTEEWIEIMKIIGLTLDEFDNFLNDKNLAKLIEALELLNRLLNDKNLQIKILEDENENLNKKNYNLNKENIFLFQQNIELKKHLEKYLENKNTGNSINKTSNIETNESSLINNISKRNAPVNSFKKFSINNNSPIINTLKGSDGNRLNVNGNNLIDNIEKNQNAFESGEINYTKNDSQLINNEKFNNKDTNDQSMKNSINYDNYGKSNNLNSYQNRNQIENSISNDEYIISKRPVENEKIKETTQKTKLKNFGETDDFSIEIETNLEMSIKKNTSSFNKAQSRNRNNNIYDNQETNNCATNFNNLDKRNKTPDNQSLNRFKTIDNITHSSHQRNSEFNKNNLILKGQINNKNTNELLNNKNIKNNLTNRNLKDNYLSTEINCKAINNKKNNSKFNNNNFNNSKISNNLMNSKYKGSNKSFNRNENTSIYDDNFNCSNINENSEVRYRPCKTNDNIEFENSRCTNLKRNMIDDMDSIIYNNIEKLFDNNINTKQISKNHIYNTNSINKSKNNYQKNEIENKNKIYNTYQNNKIIENHMNSNYFDETESYYEDEYNNRNNINQFNFCNNTSNNNNPNLNINENYNHSKSIKNQNFGYGKENTESSQFVESSDMPNSNVNESNSYKYEDSDFNSNKSNLQNNYNKTFKVDEFYNKNIINNNSIYKNHKIQNVKYINTNLNKEKEKDIKNFNETNGENTIKFGNSTEFKDNLNFGESFMSSNIGGDIDQIDVVIKNSNA